MNDEHVLSCNVTKIDDVVFGWDCCIFISTVFASMSRFNLDQFLFNTPPVKSEEFGTPKKTNAKNCKCCLSENCINKGLGAAADSSASLLSLGDHFKLPPLPSTPSESNASFDAFKYGDSLDFDHVNAPEMSDVCLSMNAEEDEEQIIKEIKIPLYRPVIKTTNDDEERPKFARFREKKYVCDACDRAFTLKQNVAQHFFLYHHPNNRKPKRIMRETTSRYQCTKCDKIFTKLEKAQRHEMREHRGEQPRSGNRRFPCVEPECTKVYATQNQLTDHINVIHKNLRPHKCDRCEMTFGRLGGLRRHVTMVHDNVTFKCPYEDCDHPGYKCSKALTAHIRSKHTFVRPYECLHCQKTFVRNNDLKVHEMTHSLTSSFPCDKCGHKFKRQVYLSKHLKKCFGQPVKQEEPSEDSSGDEPQPVKRRCPPRRAFIKLKKTKSFRTANQV